VRGLHDGLVEADHLHRADTVRIIDAFTADTFDRIGAVGSDPGRR